MNLFVAGFIGAPEMNLIEGSVTVEEGRYLFKSNALEIRLDQGMKFNSKNLDKVVLGIRPENLEIVTVQAQEESNLNSSLIKTKISMIEQMGAQTLLVSELSGNQKIRVLRDRVDKYKVGDYLNIALKESKWHIFDGLSGESLI